MVWASKELFNSVSLYRQFRANLTELFIPLEKVHGVPVRFNGGDMVRATAESLDSDRTGSCIEV
jgi:hypothetical protein